MTDHANELRRYARKIAHPAGDVPSVMLAAADEIERLAARLEAAERERDWHAERCEDAMNECAALRSKIEAMEKQEPVAWARKLGLDVPSFGCVTDLKYRPSNIPESSYIPLYTLPGAQPAPSLASNNVSLISEGKTQPAQSVKDAIIDDLQSQFDTEGITEHDSGDALIRLSDAIAAVEDSFVQIAPSVPSGLHPLKMIASAPKPGASVPEDVMRDAERYRYLRARDDGTAGVGCWIEADGRVCDRGWLYGVQLDSAIDSFIEVLAAAPKPEAKP